MRGKQNLINLGLQQTNGCQQVVAQCHETYLKKKRKKNDFISLCLTKKTLDDLAKSKVIRSKIYEKYKQLAF